MNRSVSSIVAFAAGSIIAVACSSGSSTPGGTATGTSSSVPGGGETGGSNGSGGSSNGGTPSSGANGYGGASAGGGASSGANAYSGASAGGGASSGANAYSGASTGGGASGAPNATGGASGVNTGSNSGTSSGAGGSGTGSNSGSASGSTSGGISGSSDGGSRGSSSGASGQPSPAPSASASPPACTPPTSGTGGYATRYWDCCKPSCGSSHTCGADGASRNDGSKDSCQGGSAYECYDMAPQVMSDSLAYAFAAYDGASCGTCFQLTFTGKSNDGTQDMGSQQICGKSIIVQVVNTGGLQDHQFDLLIPGGGVGANDACGTQWKVSTSQLGVQYGGLMLQCEQQDNYNYTEYPGCTVSACQSLFANSPTMEAGCEFIINWMKGANNPSVMFTQVNCPSQLTSMSGLQ